MLRLEPPQSRGAEITPRAEPVRIDDEANRSVGSGRCGAHAQRGSRSPGDLDERISDMTGRSIRSRERALEITPNKDTALDTLVREELGLDPEELGGSGWTRSG